LNNILKKYIFSCEFRNGFPLPIEFSQLVVYFNLKEYDGLANVTDPEQLKFSPNEQRILSFNFAPKTDHVQRTLEVTNSTIYFFLESLLIYFRLHLFH
jgi:hypothetical protein